MSVYRVRRSGAAPPGGGSASSAPRFPPDPSAFCAPLPGIASGTAPGPAPPPHTPVTPTQWGGDVPLAPSLSILPPVPPCVRSGESAPLYLRSLVSSTFLLITVLMMIIINYIYKGNNTRYKVIYHLDAGCWRGSCCISAPDG